MRENVLALAQNPMAGDRVSLEYLKADLYRRAEALKDLPDAPLFFGRLDYSELPPTKTSRAPTSTSAGATCTTRTAPRSSSTGAPRCHGPSTGPASPTRWGSTLRRRFGFAGGALTAYEDERFAATSGPRHAPVPKTNKPEQAADHRDRAADDPARCATSWPRSSPSRTTSSAADAATTVCVQGAPGTGKTAVGLHRVAYLLYAHKEQVTRRGVVVVGPNLAFLSYIRNVLPALGELDVTQTTVADLVAPRPVHGHRHRRGRPRSRATRGWPRCCATRCGRRSGRQRSRSWSAAGRARLRVPAYEIEALAAGAARPRRPVRHRPRTARAPHRARRSSPSWRRPGETCDDRTHDAVARSAPVRKCVDEVWPKVDPKQLVFTLLSRVEIRRSENGRGLLSDGRAAGASLWPKPPRGPGSAPWTPRRPGADRRGGRPHRAHASIAHIVVDEAQDLSPMECRAIGRRCATGCGDRARRHRAGHHAVGGDLLAGIARPPRQAGRGCPRARRGLPGAAADPRLRLPAAALDRSRPRHRPSHCGRTRTRWPSSRCRQASWASG